MARKRSGWKIYWALSIFFWIVGLTFAVLEVLGIFKDLGIVGTMVSLVLALYFGLTAATRSSVGTLQDDVGPLRDDVRTVGVVLERMEHSLGDGFGRLEQAFGRLEHGLARIERVLIERLPQRP
jgi:hypothetical protein